MLFLMIIDEPSEALSASLFVELNMLLVWLDFIAYQPL